MQEVVDSGRTGLLVEHANPQALADALATLLNQPQDAARMAAAAHAGGTTALRIEHDDRPVRGSFR